MNIIESIWNNPYLVYLQLRDPTIIVLVLYFTIVGWIERRLVNTQLRTTTIILLVFYFTIIGIGLILYNWIFNINADALIIEGAVLIGVAYGLWNLQKWAGVLGIFLSAENVIVNVYIDTIGNELWYESIWKYSQWGFGIILIIMTWNNLTPKYIIEYLNPIKRWLHNR